MVSRDNYGEWATGTRQVTSGGGAAVGHFRLTVAPAKAIVTVPAAFLTVLVVSKGDPELLRLGTRRARHFPEADDGSWAGHHPADSGEAIGAPWLPRPRPL